MTTRAAFLYPSVVTSRRTIFVRVLCSFFLLGAPSARAQPAPRATPASAAAHVAAGDRAARAKDWETALTEYRAAQRDAPSAAAQKGLASALDSLHRDADAYRAYEELVTKFGPSMTAAARAAAEARLRELAAATGLLTIRVNEAGAEVSIDGRTIGVSPVPPLLRVDAGAHRVHVTKAGFPPFDATRDVPRSASVTMDAVLEAEAKSGHLVVKSTSPDAMKVVVDGAVVGVAPWEGDVTPGLHDVEGRSAKLTAPSQRVIVARGGSTEIVLGAVSTEARIEVHVTPRDAAITIDGMPAGKGDIASAFSAGEHVLRVERAGFAPYEKKVTLIERQTYAESVVLQQVASGDASGVNDRRSYLGGLYGGIAAAGVIGVGGSGNSIDTSCNQLGAASCDTSLPVGGGLVGYGGYAWDPVGLELMVGALVDRSAPKADFDGTIRPGSNAVLAGPARREQFAFYRAGGVGAVRARATFDGSRLRVSVAAGVGIAYKQMAMQRRSSTENGTHMSDVFTPDSAGYLSPLLTFDVGARLRIARTLALAFGALLFIENAGDTHAESDPKRYLVGKSGIAPISTPSYQMATSTQFLLGPYVGFEFGP